MTTRTVDKEPPHPEPPASFDEPSRPLPNAAGVLEKLNITLINAK